MRAISSSRSSTSRNTRTDSSFKGYNDVRVATAAARRGLPSFLKLGGVLGLWGVLFTSPGFRFGEGHLVKNYSTNFRKKFRKIYIKFAQKFKIFSKILKNF